MPTILRIGSKGFALLEVMVTVSLLSLGATMIYQSSLTSLRTYGRAEDRLSLQGWIEEKIWQAKQDILEADSPEEGVTSGVFSEGKKGYPWQLKTEQVWQSEDLKSTFYRIECTVSWKEGREQKSLLRVGHVQKKKE